MTIATAAQPTIAEAPPKNPLLVVLGWIDAIGQLRCRSCAGANAIGFPVMGGARPHCDESCDFCGERLA